MLTQHCACCSARSEQKDDPDELRIQEEIKAYGDILRLDMVDTYADLSLKTLKMFSVLPAKYDADFYFKIDDDVAVNVDALAAYLAAKRNQGNLYLVRCAARQPASELPPASENPTWPPSATRATSTWCAARLGNPPPNCHQPLKTLPGRQAQPGQPLPGARGSATRLQVPQASENPTWPPSATRCAWTRVLGVSGFRGSAANAPREPLPLGTHSRQDTVRCCSTPWMPAVLQQLLFLVGGLAVSYATLATALLALAQLCMQDGTPLSFWCSVHVCYCYLPGIPVLVSHLAYILMWRQLCACSMADDRGEFPV